MRLKILRKYKAIGDGSRITPIKPFIKVDFSITPEEIDQLYDLLSEDDIAKLRKLFNEVIKDIKDK